MSIFLSFVLFAVGILFVVKGGDWFVDAASRIARAAKIPSFVIGATIVSIATTLPEMIVSVMSSLEGKNDMAVGNAVGSVIANIGLIMAIALVFMAGITPRKDYLKQCILLFAASIVLWLGCLGGQVAIWACILLLAVFAVFTFINVKQAKQTQDTDQTEGADYSGMWKDIAIFIVGAVGIIVGSRLLIDGGSDIASAIGVPERVIAVTLVAVGTSLPELVTTLTAIRKKESHMSVGNIIGANIIDLCLILPLCTFVSDNTFMVSKQSLALDFPICAILTLIAIVPMIFKEKTYKWQGFLMLAVYVVYLILVV